MQLLFAAIGAFVWSFVLAALALQAKHWRNGRLLARGEPPYKDCVFSVPLVVVSTILGVVACGAVALLHGSGLAMAVAALVAPASLGSVPTIAAISQSRGGGASPD